MGRLAPLSEEPNINEEEDATNRSSKGIMRSHTWRKWIKNHITSLAIFNKRSDFKVLLSVLGCPLFPVSALTKLPLNEVRNYDIANLYDDLGWFSLDFSVVEYLCEKKSGRFKTL